MFSKTALCFLTISQLTLSLRAQDVVPAPDPAKAAAIEQIFQPTKPDQMMEQVFAQMKAAATAQAQKSFSAQVQAFEDPSRYSQDFQKFMDQIFGVVNDRLSWQKLKPQYVHLYDETFTLEELTGVLEFYKSAAGQAMLQKMPVLVAKSGAIAQRQMGDITPEIQKISADFIANLKKTRDVKGGSPAPDR